MDRQDQADDDKKVSHAFAPLTYLAEAYVMDTPKKAETGRLDTSAQNENDSGPVSKD